MNERISLIPAGSRAVGGLVQHEERRISEEGCGDAKTLLHSERVLAKAVRAAPLQPHERQHLRDVTLVVAAEGGQHPEVLDAAQARPECWCFDQRADPTHVAGGILHALPEDCRGACSGAHEPEQHRHRRRLARAVRTDEACDDAGRNLDAQPVDRETATVLLGETVRAQRRLTPGVRSAKLGFRPPPVLCSGLCFSHSIFIANQY
jgi:hypothetical protein